MARRRTETKGPIWPSGPDAGLKDFHFALLVLCASRDDGVSPYDIELVIDSGRGGVLGKSAAHVYEQIKVLADVLKVEGRALIRGVQRLQKLAAFPNAELRDGIAQLVPHLANPALWFEGKSHARPKINRWMTHRERLDSIWIGGSRYDFLGGSAEHQCMMTRPTLVAGAKRRRRLETRCASDPPSDFNDAARD